jgi:hypothetical protein
MFTSRPLVLVVLLDATPPAGVNRSIPGRLSQKGFLSGMFNTIPVCRRTSLKVAASRDSFSRRM